MRHPVFAACFVLSIAACGGAPPAHAPVSGSASDAGSVANDPGSGMCTASSARQVPMHFWKQVGTLVVLVQGKEPVSVEMRDGSGRSIETAKASTKPEMRAQLEKMTCRLGGVLYLTPGGKPPDGPVELKVLAAASQDPKKDLDGFCGVPDMPQGFDPSQQRRIAVEIFEESLSSTKWREWLFTLTGKLRTASDQDAPAIRKKAGEELSAAAKSAGIQDCWFATSLMNP